jgi:hypothetical protein
MHMRDNPARPVIVVERQALFDTTPTLYEELDLTQQYSVYATCMVIFMGIWFEGILGATIPLLLI